MRTIDRLLVVLVASVISAAIAYRAGAAENYASAPSTGERQARALEQIAQTLKEMQRKCR